MLQDLMTEAMEETDGQYAPGLQQNGKHWICKHVFFSNMNNVTYWYLYYLSFAGAHEESNQELDPPSSDLFLFPDESGNLHQDLSPTYPMLHSPLITPVPTLTQETDDFCILETPGSRGDVRIYIYVHKL